MAIILLLTLKKLLFVKFWSCIKEEHWTFLKGLLKYPSLFHLHICVRLKFIHIINKTIHTKPPPPQNTKYYNRLMLKHFITTKTKYFQFWGLGMKNYDILVRETRLFGETSPNLLRLETAFHALVKRNQGWIKHTSSVLWALE